MSELEKHEGVQFLRFLCILWVALFHFFYFRSFLFPFRSTFNNLFFSMGWIGVRIFFIISGFVIYLSLQNSRNFVTFLKKRALRLYPSLWLILPLVFLCQRYVPYSPFTELSKGSNLAISMTLLPPNTLNIPLGLNLSWLTLVLWSLKVEVFFYLTVSILYFIGPKEKCLLVLLALSFFAQLVYSTDRLETNRFGSFAIKIIDAFGWKHLPWFCLGALLSQKQIILKNKRLIKKFLILGSFLLSFALTMSPEMQSIYQWLCLIVTTTISCLVISRLRKLPLIFKPFILLGDSSYEMYLLHQGVGLTFALFLTKASGASASTSTLICATSILAAFALSHGYWHVSLRIQSRLKPAMKFSS